VFVDESKRRDFVLVAGAVLPGALATARQSIRALYLPGQKGIHMVREKPGRQRTILEVINQLDVEVVLYVAPRGAFKTQNQARKCCLEQLVMDMGSAGHSDLLIERDDTLAAEDRRVIRNQLALQGSLDTVRYRHGKVQGEPLLAIPDAIGWAWPQKGDWRRRCDPVVVNVKMLDGP
jgi:hypothetical protein